MVSPSTIKIQNLAYFPNVLDLHLASSYSCSYFVDLLSGASKNLIQCLIHSARPFTFCQDCVESYLWFSMYWSALLNGTFVDFQGGSCFQVYLSRDTFGSLQRMQQFVEQIWSDAHCDNCFKSASITNNGSLVVEISDEADAYFSRVDVLFHCLSNFSDVTIETVEVWTNSTFNRTACNVCNKYFVSLHNFYAQVKPSKRLETCLDVVDRINYTRLLFTSKDAFGCSRAPPNWTLLLPLWTVLILSVIFYSNIVCCAHKDARFKIYRQARLAFYEMKSSEKGPMPTPTTKPFLSLASGFTTHRSIQHKGCCVHKDPQTHYSQYSRCYSEWHICNTIHDIL